MTMRAGRIASGVLVLLVGCDSTWTLKGATPDPQESAKEALGLLQGVVDDKNYRTAGFDSVGEARRAVLGKPIDVYVLQVDKLKDWNRQGDPNAKVLETKSVEVVYPVMVGDQTKSTVSIFKDDDGYRPATFGDAEIARILARYRRSDADVIVQVPVVGSYFIGRRSDDQVSLIPAYSVRRLPYQPGQPVSSAELLPKLADLANEPESDMPR
jgi:hypothetical protein